MGKLTLDPLAIAALIGFLSLIAIFVGLTVWVIKQAYKAPRAPRFPAPDDDNMSA